MSDEEFEKAKLVIVGAAQRAAERQAAEAQGRKPPQAGHNTDVGLPPRS